MGPRGRRLVTGAVVAALLLPVAVDRDGLPLSTYPMYSSARGSEVTLVTAYGVDRDGARLDLSLDLIGRSDDPLVVAGELRAAVAAGRARARCVEIASRVARRERHRLDAVEVVSERYDVVARVEDGAGPVARRVHARCDVEGAP